MTLSQDTINELRAMNGATTTLGNSETPPHGYTFIGAINALENEMGKLNAYDVAYSDLSPKRQGEIETIHAALQWHIGRLSNLLATDVISHDEAIELPNGKRMDLPKTAINAPMTVDIPTDPTN